MSNLSVALITIFAAFAAYSGFWSFYYEIKGNSSKATKEEWLKERREYFPYVLLILGVYLLTLDRVIQIANMATNDLLTVLSYVTVLATVKLVVDCLVYLFRRQKPIPPKFIERYGTLIFGLCNTSIAICFVGYLVTK